MSSVELSKFWWLDVLEVINGTENALQTSKSASAAKLNNFTFPEMWNPRDRAGVGRKMPQGEIISLFLPLFQS